MWQSCDTLDKYKLHAKGQSCNNHVKSIFVQQRENIEWTQVPSIGVTALDWPISILRFDLHISEVFLNGQVVERFWDLLRLSGWLENLGNLEICS